MKKWIFGMAAIAAAMCFGATTGDGVTKERRGALGPNDTVVTDVDATGIVAARTYTKAEVDRRIATNAPVRSVNGKTGQVVLGANDVGALPNNRDGLKANANFRNAVWDVQIKSDVDANAVRDIAREEIVPATNRLNQTLSDALAAKRDLTNNVCRKTEFTEWICNPPRTEFGGVYSIRYDSPVKVYSLFDKDEVVEEIYSPTDDKLNLEFVGYCTATRSLVCTSNELFVTQSFVTNAVNAAKYVPNAADQTFSNAVLAVQIDTNTVAQIGELKEFFDDLPTGTAATSLGGIVLALLGAAVYLKKKTALLENDGKASNTFATDLLGKQVAISAMKYGLVSTSSTVKAADRTVTKVTLGTTAVTVTFPDADENGKTRDFLLRIDAANLATGGSLNITKPTGATIYGDAFPSPEATKQYLVAITETAANEFYVRTIEITIPTEA